MHENNNTDYYFVNQTSHNVYNVYNNNDNAFPFDPASNIQNQCQLQQDLYHVNNGDILQQTLYSFDNKVSESLLYDYNNYAVMGSDALLDYNNQSIIHEPITCNIDAYIALNENFLQDDTFSIATVSDFNNLSTHAITPLSTPSPQLSDLSSNYGNSQFIQPLQYNDQKDFLFAPIEECLPSSYQLDFMVDSRKSKCTTNSDKKHICPICNHRSKRKHNLVEHMLTHNPNRPKDFRCSFCTRPFARKYDMKRHEKIHTR